MKNLTLFNNKDLFKDFDSMFDSFWAVPKKNGSYGFNLLTDVEEDAKAFHLTMDIPGIEKDDIHIDVNNGELTVSGEREYKNEDKKAHRYERSYGSFRRSFTLPTTVKAEDIEANYDKGVLSLTIPKVETSDNSTRVLIK